MLSRTVEARSKPRAFRSSVTNAIPSLQASVGKLTTDRLAVDQRYARRANRA